MRKIDSQDITYITAMICIAIIAVTAIAFEDREVKQDNPDFNYCAHLYLTPTPEAKDIFKEIGCNEEAVSNYVTSVRSGKY